MYFIKSPKSCVYEMDGDANEPLQTGITLKDGQDLSESAALDYIIRCIARSKGNLNFSRLALVHNTSNQY